MKPGTVLALVCVLTACAPQEVAQGPASRPSASPSSSAPTQAPTPSPARPQAVVDDLLAALGADPERAWALLTEQSQQGFGSYAAFEDLQTEYAEGLAAFSGLPGQVLDLGGGAAVVTVSGEVSREGETDVDAFALGVRGDRVDLTAPMQPVAVSIEVPGSGAQVASGSELRALVPARSTPVVAADGQVQEHRAEAADGDRLVVTSSPRLSAGEHVLTVAAVRADGVVVAEALVFRVS